MYWIFNINNYNVDISDLFFLPTFASKTVSIPYMNIQGFFRTDSNGLYTNTFGLVGAIVNARVNGDVATISVPQPLRFDFGAYRYNYNDNVAEQRSALYEEIRLHGDDGSRYSADLCFEIQSSTWL